MAYNKMVLQYCLEPKNCRSMDKNDSNVGFGQVGSAACGDIVQLFLKIHDGKIVDASFKAFGCGSAIAASAFGTELLNGKNVDTAQSEVTNEVLFNTLKLPPIKRHCSILVEECIAEAIRDYNSTAKTNARIDLV